MSRDEVADELAAVSSIYGDAVTILPPGHAGGVTTVTAAVPVGGGAHAALLTLTLTDTYPSEAPSWGLEGAPRGVRDAVGAALGAVLAAHASAPVLFPLIEALRELVGATDVAAEAEAAPHAPPPPQYALPPPRAPAAARGLTVFHGAPVIVSRSTFVAHVARVASRDDVDAVLAELREDGRVARATHNMFAWRIRLPSGALAAENDDDGEDAAGGRLAHLLELMGADGVLVVVSRWFGGVLLGPQRFKVIADTARLGIEASPWCGATARRAGK